MSYQQTISFTPTDYLSSLGNLGLILGLLESNHFRELSLGDSELDQLGEDGREILEELGLILGVARFERK